MTAAVVLAAGAGVRLGGVAKAVLHLSDGRTYLRAIHDAGRAAGVRRWIVVTGAPHDGVTEDEARALGLEIARNPAPERGMASSVALGFAWALDHLAGHQSALLWPVDHPCVRAATVGEILAQVDGEGALIPMYQGRGGHPTAFGRRSWPALAACAQAPRGARSVLEQTAGVRRIEVADPGVIVDVDTQTQLARVSGALAATP